VRSLAQQVEAPPDLERQEVRIQEAPRVRVQQEVPQGVRRGPEQLEEWGVPVQQGVPVR
jgi:hypothetical protein